MGLFSGPSIARREVQEDVEERGTYYAPRIPADIGTFAETTVTPSTAAQSVAIRSTADLIASLGSELPIDVWTDNRGKKRKVSTPGSLEDPGGDERGREDWAYQLLWNWLITGNNVGAVIDRDGAILRTVDLFNPDDVSASVMDGKPMFVINGRSKKDEDDFAHWRVNPISGRLMGLSPIEHHATTIGISLATSRFGRQWFVDGAHPSGVLTNDSVDMTEPIADAAKAKVLEKRGTSEPIVLGKGWKWENAQVTPEESQFLQTQGLSEAQCARIFGPGFAEVFGFETGAGKSMTYANLVDRRQDLLVMSMNRWLRRYERVLSKFVPRTQWVEVNRDALLEATTKQRYEAYASALTNKWKTVNEIREHENLDPVPWGNEPITAAAPAAPAPKEDSDGDDD